MGKYLCLPILCFVVVAGNRLSFVIIGLSVLCENLFYTSEFITKLVSKYRGTGLVIGIDPNGVSYTIAGSVVRVTLKLSKDKPKKRRKRH